MGQVVYPVKFNNIDLNTISGLTVLRTNPYIFAKRTLDINQIARSNAAKVNTGFYTDRQIAVRVNMSQNTRALLEQSIDSLAGILQGLEKDLILPQSGTLRRYTATYADSVVKEDGGSYIEMDLIFATSDHYGYSLQYEKLLDATARTLYNYTDSFTVNGSADTQVPVITAFISAFTGATNNTVTIKNAATTQAIAVNRAWVAGDRLVVDVSNKSVQVNNADANYTGAFPEFAGNGTTGYLNYQDDFKTRTLALSAYYYRRYV